jgi:hypothetical protein
MKSVWWVVKSFDFIFQTWIESENYHNSFKGEAKDSSE